MQISLWYCVNGSGQAKVFVTKPERNEKRRCWMGDINIATLRFVDWLEVECGYVLPEITWKDEPVVLTIDIEHEET